MTPINTQQISKWPSNLTVADNGITFFLNSRGFFSGNIESCTCNYTSSVVFHIFSVKKANERAKVTFAYEPENADELKLVEGDIISILNKDITESEGWWEGELNGKVGMFPNNFVELLPPEEEAKVRKTM